MSKPKRPLQPNKHASKRAAAAAEQARLEAEAAAAQSQAAPPLTCYGGDAGTTVQMPCDFDYCTSIG